MTTLTILRGLPGSGKSTWARKHVDSNTVIVSLDGLREMMAGGRQAWHETMNPQLNRILVRQAHTIISDLLAKGVNVISDSQHVNPRFCVDEVQIAVRHKAHVETFTFNTPLDELLERNRIRVESDRVPEKYLRTQYETWHGCLERDSRWVNVRVMKTDGVYRMNPMGETVMVDVGLLWDGNARTVDNINGYLIDAPDLYVGKRSQKTGPVSPLLDVTDSGSMPLDGGNLLLADREEYDRAMADPIAARFVRPFRMGRELINGTDRWCLWLRDAEPGELRKSSFLKKRVDACAEYRRNAPTKGDAYKHRATPWLFRDDHQPSTNYLAIPKVFSEDREYMTCDWYTPDIIAGDMVYTSPDRDGLAFAVIESRMFMTWQQTIGGRLESRCRFSNTVVWNNLPLPALDDDTRAALIEAGRNVLAARANHPGQSLADLYDPDYMPTDLRAAHLELDKIADVAFGAGKWLKDDDDTRLQVLFKSYTRMTGSSEV